MFFAEVKDLALRQRGQREHTNVGLQNLPVPLGPQGLEFLVQQFAHTADAIGHGAYILQELLVEVVVCSYQFDNMRPVYRGQGPRGAHDLCELCLDVLRHGLITGLGVDNMGAAYTLSIQTKVFGVRLRNDAFDPALREKPDCESVVFETAGREALVGDVKEGDMLLSFHNIENFPPLVGGWVNSRGVVGYGLEQYNLSILEVT